jgi:hypothetical protein
LLRFLKKTPQQPHLSRHLFRIFPATEKDFFANASRPFKGKNAPTPLVTSPKEI